MKKILVSVAGILFFGSTFAGGYLTNTNQNVAFLRNPAQLAAFDLGAAYSNPAGLAWLGNGWHFGFNWQNAAQTRSIRSTFAPFAYNLDYPNQETRTFKGEATAPIVPSFDVAYQKEKWTVSLHFGITGGGGKATFNNGLPMFESQIAYANVAAGQAAAGVNSLGQMLRPFEGALAGMGISLPSAKASKGYTLETYMSGRQYIYGVQAGLTYKIFDNLGDMKQGLSAFVGARMNFASNAYEGYLRNTSATMPEGNQISLSQYMNDVAKSSSDAAATATTIAQHLPAVGPGLGLDEAQIAAYVAQLNGAAKQLGDASNALSASATRLDRDIELDCTQSDWGIAPIIGVDYRIGEMNFGMRYEFNTAMNIENKTRVNTTGSKEFADGVNTPNDIPSILAIGAQYGINTKFRVMAGWNCYFDKNAGMSGGKEKYLDRNTHEITAGIEYDVLDRLTVSGGFQNTDYGASDDFQNDLSFHCDSYSLGFGVRVKVNKKVDVDAAYFWTNYKDYTKESSNYNNTGLPGKDVYSRTNRVFGLGVTYRL